MSNIDILFCLHFFIDPTVDFLFRLHGVLAYSHRTALIPFSGWQLVSSCQAGFKLIWIFNLKIFKWWRCKHLHAFSQWQF